MDSIKSSTSTEPITETQQLTVEQQVPTQPVLKLRLKKPKTQGSVSWSEDTVDNEHMNKKKSKCCCIYKKPLQFGESSTEDEDDCDNCFGHPEKRKKNRKRVTSNKSEHCCKHDDFTDAVADLSENCGSP
ncbi:E3 ubiquitin-protein ligase PPP1R11-like [Teleopsis dalmanni]|uniref:E3 ubiquitin-protein ligase PPP1R11-like n=1 Tax=Teleopsis dalmanni TaxID=139649 RepID=UPI0018CF9809|nr:E3 ubiquitin-protein ligase PPP1R11-like [Teleopsis dalmanni]